MSDRVMPMGAGAGAVSGLLMWLAIGACGDNAAATGPEPAPPPAPSGDAGRPADEGPSVQAGLDSPRNVLTHHNDNARTGAYLQETLLNVNNVHSGSFGELRRLPVDGRIFAQPLYVHGLEVSIDCRDGGPHHDGVHDVVFIATVNNTLYAFDADGQRPCNSDDLYRFHEDDAVGLVEDQGTARGGLISTPVIDPERGVITFMERVLSPDQPASLPVPQRQAFFKLVSVDLRTGKKVREQRVDENIRDGGKTFVASSQLNRPALLLTRGASGSRRIVAAFGASNEDNADYYGWVLAFDADTLALTGAHCTTQDPADIGAGIWQSGNGPAADGAGNVYLMTGNGCPYGNDACASRSQLDTNEADRFLKLSADTMRTVVRSASPGDHQLRERFDVDLGSGGPLLVPDSGKVVGGAKNGRLYILDRDTMSFALTGANGAAVGAQAAHNVWHLPPIAGDDLPRCSKNDDAERAALTPCRIDETEYEGDMDLAPNLHGNPIYWVDADATPQLYFWAEKDYVRQVHFVDHGDTAEIVPWRVGSVAAPRETMPGGILSLSARGSTRGTGILWATTTALDPAYCGAAFIRCAAQAATVRGHFTAFDAEDVSRVLWETDIETFSKFTPPTVADGRVFVPTMSGYVLVFGLRATN